MARCPPRRGGLNDRQQRPTEFYSGRDDSVPYESVAQHRAKIDAAGRSHAPPCATTVGAIFHKWLEPRGHANRAGHIRSRLRRRLAVDTSVRGAERGCPGRLRPYPVAPTQQRIEAGCDNNPTHWNEGIPDGFAADVANDIYVSILKAAAAALSLPAAAGEPAAWYPHAALTNRRSLPRISQ
jgi:hypothetical protein